MAQSTGAKTNDWVSEAKHRKDLHYAKYILGTKILKPFEGYDEKFLGVVLKYFPEDGGFLVVYADGDREDVDLDEILKYRIEGPQTVPSSSDIERTNTLNILRNLIIDGLHKDQDIPTKLSTLFDDSSYKGEQFFSMFISCRGLKHINNLIKLYLKDRNRNQLLVWLKILPMLPVTEKSLGIQRIAQTIDSIVIELERSNQRSNILQPSWFFSSSQDRLLQRHPSNYSPWMSFFSDIYFSLSCYPNQAFHTEEHHSSIIKELKSTLDDPDEEKRAKSMLASLASVMQFPMVRFLGYILSKLWRHLFQAVYVDVESLNRLREVLKEKPCSVVFLPSHKSHLDYLLVSYVCFAYDLPIPYIAAGTNLNLPIVGPILRASGSFFIRRSSQGDACYKQVLRAYVHSLIRADCCIEFFIEGGRSRHGRICKPRLGLLSILAKMFNEELSHQKSEKDLEQASRDVILVPLSLDYDKILEVDGYCQQLMGKDKVQESLWVLFKSTLKLLFTNCGTAYVRFGKSISLRENLGSVECLGNAIVDGIQKAATITVTSLVSSLLLAYARDRFYSRNELEHRLSWLVRKLLQKKTVQAAAFLNVQEAIEQALQLLNQTVIIDSSKRLKIASGMKEKTIILQLSYYRNQLLHVFLPEALICCALSALKASPFSSISRNHVIADAIQLLEIYRFICYHPSVDWSHVIDKLLKDLVLVEDSDGNLHIEKGEPASFYGSLAFPIIDSLWSVFQVLRIVCNWKSRIEVKEVVQYAQSLIYSLYLQHKLLYLEAICGETLKACISFLENIHIIRSYNHDNISFIEVLEDEITLEEYANDINRYRKTPLLISKCFPDAFTVRREYIVASMLFPSLERRVF